MSGAVVHTPTRLTDAGYVAGLAMQAEEHRAVRHPYLHALATAGSNAFDLRWMIVDFATHYIGYSQHFPRYLIATALKLEDAEQRGALITNLSQEAGQYDETELHELAAYGIEREWIVGVAHPRLFARFYQAVGAPDRRSAVEADQVICWRETLLAVLTSGSAAEAVGALGLGTEGIVRKIYAPISRAVEQLGLAPRDTVFFPLHTIVDDAHQETLQAIAISFARTEQGRRDLRRGMLKALQLRAAFWDWMFDRAKDPKRAEEVL